MKADITNLAKPGFVIDQPDLMLVDGAWTDSRNIEYRDGAIEKAQGYAQVFSDLSVTAIWAAPISDGSNYFWVYGSGTVMYATDGTTHANITGSITLGATDDLNYSGGPFHGYMLVNDGVSMPQTWTPSLSNDLVSLSAWPAVTTTCKVMRTFKDFIFALRVTEGGIYNPRLILWSDRANPGALPGSWDYADPTNQAGINELAQTQDIIVDALPLRDSMMFYKENHTWMADYIGGDDIFGFRQVFSQIGLLSERCAIAFGSQHLVWTDQDIVLHDGNNARSILDGRARRWFFNRININRYKRCYAIADYRKRVAYFCYPEYGYDWPTMALAWNWHEDTLQPIELGGPKTWAETGITPASGTTIDGDSGTIDSATGLFDDESYSPFTGAMVLLDANRNRAYQHNTGETFGGTAMSVYAERSGWALSSDMTRLKRIVRLYPRIIGNVGDTIDFHVGVRTTPNAPVQWRGPFRFRIGIDYKIDLRVTGRVLDFRVNYTGSNTWRMHGIGVEFEADGLR